MTLNSGDVLVYDGNNWVNSSYAGYTKVVLSQPGLPAQTNGMLNRPILASPPPGLPSSSCPHSCSCSCSRSPPSPPLRKTERLRSEN